MTCLSPKWVQGKGRVRKTQEAEGFTLIELLVAISVLALIIALLLPTLNASREVARLAICQSNLRQQGIGFASYVTDYRFQMPFRPGWAGAATSGLERGTYEWLMAPYMAAGRPDWVDNPGGHYSVDNVNSPIFWCPSSPVVQKRAVAPWGLDYENGFYGQANGYQGALYHHYFVPWAGTPAEKNHGNLGGPLNYAAIARMTQEYFTRPFAVPYKFCSRVNFPAALGGPATNDIYDVYSSWHRNASSHRPRPTLLLDGRVALLTNPVYTDGSDYNPGGTAGQRRLRVGPYSPWNLQYGGGAPQHKPWDFWIDDIY